MEFTKHADIPIGSRTLKLTVDVNTPTLIRQTGTLGTAEDKVKLSDFAAWLSQQPDTKDLPGADHLAAEMTELRAEIETTKEGGVTTVSYSLFAQFDVSLVGVAAAKLTSLTVTYVRPSKFFSLDAAIELTISAQQGEPPKIVLFTGELTKTRDEWTVTGQWQSEGEESGITAADIGRALSLA
ncbi:hypothetical protein ABZ791_02085 [Streptomyces huasconensis]|uniref:Uncharacterized protein n=1 Tax=Streptomyces huasconensis TaxID=1854574 RepID=A0ABV3LRK8_9ACTN